MALHLGIDIGAVSVTAALLGDHSDRDALAQAATLLPGWQLRDTHGTSADRTHPLLLSDYRRLLGEPLRAVHELIADLTRQIPVADIAGLTVIGSGAQGLAARLGARSENEYRALAAAAGLLHPEARTIIEMGGETSKFLLLERDGGITEIRDYASSGECAAGTGSFIDQQASRLGFEVEEIGGCACGVDRAARIAGRCSVFAKSDMIHAQQKGYNPEEILRGLCDAVSRNYKGNIARGRKIVAPALFIGGVARNSAVCNSLREIYDLTDEQLITPDNGPWFGAIGAALLETRADAAIDFRLDPAVLLSGSDTESETQAPLDLSQVDLLRDQAELRPMSTIMQGEAVYLGVDVGSVSTNLVLIDDEGRMVHEIYLPTRGRPVEVVGEGLREIETALAGRGCIAGVGATGSGRELVGQLIGADTINDEITAHKTGADYIARRLTGREVDTIFEIGGQDSKYISLESGVVVDFAMNEACAAGTGSFLEEQAERMGIAIKGEFAELALTSQAPGRMGERCTVFMERDLNARLRRGAPLPDLCAGLAYSIVFNYLNRVVGDRKVGDVIYFQGGTAYNDAVAAAFAGVLGKRIIVPPHNGVVGAIGMALLAREKAEATGENSDFRGFDVEKIDYSLRKFTCKACSNDCDMEEFTVDGVKTYWGDKCGERYRRRGRAELEPVTEDLIAYKQRKLKELHEQRRSAGAAVRVGLPRAMYYYDRFPFWATWLDELGVDVVVSEPTNRAIAQAGQEHTVAEPCYPVVLAHGHVHSLLEKKVDWLLLPNVINAEANPDQVESYLCLWGQTLPFVVRSSPALEPAADRMLVPRIRFAEGEDRLKIDLRETAAQLGCGARENERAIARACEAQRDFNRDLYAKGREVMAAAAAAERELIVLLGRPYNLFDEGVNLAVPRKLRDLYGVNVLPMDFLDLADEEVSDLHHNMFWDYGRRILAAARLAGRTPNMHLIYITNFKCGPDSFIKQYVTQAAGRPFLTLQFDGHANDAGVLTRCEAYLDSKGVLRWWSRQARATA
ncbi:MAG: hypothetical protein GY835_11035 [bacterium]|nr:hypothetical protein [bacterium]